MLVVLGDVDAAGVLYFGAVFRWHERELSEWMASIGQPFEQVFLKGRGIPVRSAEAEYPNPASLGTELSVELRCSDVQESQFVFETTWKRADGRVAALVRTLHIACERDSSERFRRTSIWAELQHAIDEHSARHSPRHPTETNFIEDSWEG